MPKYEHSKKQGKFKRARLVGPEPTKYILNDFDGLSGNSLQKRNCQNALQRLRFNPADIFFSFPKKFLISADRVEDSLKYSYIKNGIPFLNKVIKTVEETADNVDETIKALHALRREQPDSKHIRVIASIAYFIWGMNRSFFYYRDKLSLTDQRRFDDVLFTEPAALIAHKTSTDQSLESAFTSLMKIIRCINFRRLVQECMEEVWILHWVLPGESNLDKLHWLYRYGMPLQTKLIFRIIIVIASQTVSLQFGCESNSCVNKTLVVA